MKKPGKAAIWQFTRTLHAWLGILIFPLIIVVGFTGFYLNHARTVFAFLESTPYDEAQFEEWPTARITDLDAAKHLAETLWPDTPVGAISSDMYHEWPVYILQMPDAQLIVSRETGHYYTKTTFHRKTYSPDGDLVDSKFYWGSLFKWLHVRGWPSDLFGTLLTDITSIAMIVFAFSGVILWWFPRIKKFRRAMGRIFS